MLDVHAFPSTHQADYSMLNPIIKSCCPPPRQVYITFIIIASYHRPNLLNFFGIPNSPQLQKPTTKKWYNITQEVLVEHIHMVIFISLCFNMILVYFLDWFVYFFLYTSIIFCTEKNGRWGCKSNWKLYQLEVTDHIRLQQIVATTLESIKTKYGQHRLDGLHCFCQSQVDSTKKTKWLKVWNANNDTKHAAFFP